MECCVINNFISDEVNKMKIEILERNLIPGKIYTYGTSIWFFVGFNGNQIILKYPEEVNLIREYIYTSDPTRVWTFEKTFIFGRWTKQN